MSFPVFAAYVANQCDRRSDLFSVAREIRNSPEAVALRSWIASVQRRITDERDLRKVKKALDELIEVSAVLRRSLKLQERNETEIGKIKLAIPYFTAELPLKIPTGLPHWIRTMFSRRTHMIWLKELARESISLPAFANGYHRLLP